ncbi:hypothetical protein C8F04DRAFT_1186086 [Mycena alexandri]|uniref:Uncharacterized protein n=1 Tax=Mycena alexandri TaxID=1745969 RepID=A0AAD6SRN1_9AGAR|nr:hypothetical protein C8F04DRAFT_1186086 [Mycena alexandri]
MIFSRREVIWFNQSSAKCLPALLSCNKLSFFSRGFNLATILLYHTLAARLSSIHIRPRITPSKSGPTTLVRYSTGRRSAFGAGKRWFPSSPYKMDLHEPLRYLASLSPYEHLNRLFRLCVAHSFRNIRKCKVSDLFKDLMRSLVCMEHADWDGTIEKIKNLGGKAGQDWVQDKERTRFAFQGMCWMKSSIPREVWQAGEHTSNLIESVHADINREGVHCTHLGGVLKGEFYDALQMKELRVFEQAGIQSSYSTGHPTENAIKNLKRKFNAYRKGLEASDTKIREANTKIQDAYVCLSNARNSVNVAAAALLNCHPLGHLTCYASLLRAVELAERCLTKEASLHRKEVEFGKMLMGTGTTILFQFPLSTLEGEGASESLTNRELDQGARGDHIKISGVHLN